MLGKHLTAHRGANTIELLKEGRGREEGEQGGVLNGPQFYIFGGEKVRSSL